MKPDRDRRGLTVHFWGTRGSLPRPGAEFARYGGNTSCVEIRLGDRLFLIDGGTGIEPAGRALKDSWPASVDILFSHLHHDHIAGLPFFAPIFDDRCTIRTFCGNLDGSSAEDSFGRMFAPPLFPIVLDQLPCQWAHIGFRAGETLTFEGGIAVRTCLLKHPGGATAYRFDHAGRSVCYVSDLEHEPGASDPALVDLCSGADLVIYDSMFTEGEFQACRGWGHSTLDAGILLCRTARAKALAATHHHIRYTDPMLDRLDAELRAALPGSFLAREGQTVRIGAAAARPLPTVAIAESVG